MKAKEVQVGGDYMTKVCKDLVRVRVLYMHSTERGPRFTVRRVDNGAVLPKRRVAAALSPIPIAPWLR